MNGERTVGRDEYHPSVILETLYAFLQDVTRERGVWTFSERVTATVRPIVGLGLVIGIHALVRRHPWPRPFRVRFALFHAVVSAVVAVLWIAISRLIEALFLGWGSSVPFEEEFFVIGILGYLIAAGISYSVESTARAARAEAAAASTQLSALRAQLHPHFLFNALHTVVQLIPVNPAQAMEAAELVAELLRRALEEKREEVPLADEWRFVSRYLAMERLRFGDRLEVRESLPPGSLGAQVPSFALQTLVENAVRHGAAPRVTATEIEVSATGGAGEALTLVVRDRARHGDGSHVGPGVTARREGEGGSGSDGEGTGTGLARLRERLAVLYGDAATLAIGPVADGYEATLVIPQARRAAAGAGQGTR